MISMVNNLKKIQKPVFISLGLIFLHLLILNSLFPTQSDDLGAVGGGY